MKNTVLIVVAALIVVFGVVSTASAQTRCNLNLDDTFGTCSGASWYDVGDTVHYFVSLQVTEGVDNCPVEIDSIYFWPPPAPPNDPCTDPNLDCSWYAPGGGLELTPGDPGISVGACDPGLAGGTHYPFTCMQYVVQPSDIGGVLRSRLCTHFTNLDANTEEHDQKSHVARVRCPEPCLEVRKGVECETSKVGDTLVYWIEVENCVEYDVEQLNLFDLEVTDDLLADQHGSPLPGFPSVLEPGQVHREYFTYEVQPGDNTSADYPDDILVNTAYATAYSLCDTTLAEAESEPVTAYIIDPGISVAKTCLETDPVPPGEDAEFQVVISNTGDILLDVTTDEAQIPGTRHIPAFTDSTYVVTRPCGDEASVSNTINVHATIPDGFCDLPNYYDDDATAECPCGECELLCTKTVTPEVSKYGHEVTYELCAINDGTGCDLTLVSVIDDQLGVLTSYFSPTLASGDSECQTFPYPIPEGDADSLVNIAVFTYETPTAEAVACTSRAVVYIIHPGLDVEVQCLTDPVPEGEEGQFGVTITNTGDVDLEVTTTWAEHAGPFTLAPEDAISDTAHVPCEGPETCFGIGVHGELPDMYFELYGLDNTYADTAYVCCPCPGENGCTPGFWKNHPDCWCDRFDPNDLLGSVFAVPSPELDDYADDTLMDGMNYGGGKGVEGAARNLFRSAVAAILNGCSDDVPYPMTADAVIAAVNAALATLDRHEILAVHTMLDDLNNLGCSIDAHCRPIEDGEPDYKLREDNTGEVVNPAESKMGLTPAEVWSQPIPNPFMGTTIINFGIPKSGTVAIDVYDVAGRHVASVFNGEKAAGTHEAGWNGRDSRGVQVPAGVYFYRFAFDNEILMKKMLVVK